MFEKKKNYKVEGMTCDHCVMHVTEALESVKGVKDVKVSLKKNNAVIRFSDADLGLDEEVNIFARMERAVDEAGYHLMA
jgi:copper chaperone